MALIDLTKQEFSKTQYERVIDTSFTELTPLPPQTSITFTPTVSEFFQYYQSLFFQIPKLGEIDSHQYLIQTSGDYVGELSNTDDTVQALIEEITQLRQENLDLQIQINQITQTPTGSI